MWLPYGKETDDRRSNRVDTVHECDTQTGRQTNRQIYDDYDDAMHNVAR